jgi:predicted unusual protein kinase regulating ubiquinone biosynthesis (AarF/ABC1/UbiB family)
MTGATDRTFAARAAASGWLGADRDGVPAAVALDAAAGPAHRDLPRRAVELAQPGLVDPFRVARHATAASVSRMLRLATGLPGAVASGRPLNDPGGWARDTAVEAFVDQLALAGPAGAELARFIEGGGALFPEALRRELGRRRIRPLDVPPEVVQALLERAFPPPAGSAPGEPVVRLLHPVPLTGTPVAQLHRARLLRGTSGAAVERPVLVRARRPRVARDLVNDARMAAGAAAVLRRVASEMAEAEENGAGAPGAWMGVGPVSFVRLALRAHLDAVDQRFEALGLIELGLLAEELGVPVTVARPVPGLADERAVVIEDLDGVPLTRWSGPLADPDGAVRAVVALTIEAALVHGVFWADPAPEHLLVRPDGTLALVGVGVLGRLSPELLLAGVRTLRAVLTGDHAGMVDGLRQVGAVGPDVDTDALVADLSRSVRLDPMQLLMGGEQGLQGALNSLVGTLLAHRLEPPVEVMLLLRTIFAAGRLVGTLTPGDGPGPGLMGALLPLLPRLPDLLARAEASAEAADPGDAGDAPAGP